MKRKLGIPPDVRRKIGAAGLSRSAVVRLYLWVRPELELNADGHSHNRVSDRPQCFRARKVIVDGSTWFACTFIVNDATAGQLTIEDFACQPRGE